MTLIDDTCDGCGARFDPMGDPYLKRHPEISAYAVYCASCEKSESEGVTPVREDLEEHRNIMYRRFLKLSEIAKIVNDLDDLIDVEGVGVDVSAIDIKRRLERALAFGDDEQ